MNNKTQNHNALLWIWRRSKKFAFAIFLLTLLGVISAVSFVALALVSKWLLDIATGDAVGSIATCAVWLFAIILFQILLNALSSMLKVHITAKLTMSMRSHLFTSVMRKKYAFLSAHHSGDILNRFTADTDVVVNAVVTIIPNTVSTFAKIAAGAGTLLLLNWRFALIALAVGVCIPAIGRLINNNYKHLHKECQRTEGETRSFLQECFENSMVIKSFVSEVPFLTRLKHSMKENYSFRMKRNNFSIIATVALHAFFTIAYYFVLVWGAGMIAAGTMTYGTLMAFLQLISQLRTPLQNVSGIIPQYYSALASAERILELENGDAEPQKNDKLEEFKNDFKHISIKDVFFSYGEEKALKNCSFYFKRDEMIALIGKSGCGKSTLFKLLLGLYEPNEGSITINGKKKLDASLRGLFTFVPQGSFILSGTIRDNITLYDESVTDERLIEVAKNAEIYDYICELPLGFDTVLSERGAGLSEGQLQRIAIARALLYDAPILLLDEATSALDEQTEKKVLSNIKALPDKTVLFITHRKKSLELCDRVIKTDGKKFEEIAI